MTLWNTELHTLPGYYLVSSFPVRFNSAWRARMEAAVLSLNIYVSVWDFRILYLLENMYSFMLPMFLPLDVHKKRLFQNKWRSIFEQCLTKLLTIEHGCSMHPKHESRDKCDTWVKAAQEIQGFSSLCSYQLQLKSALDFLTRKRKIICESVLLRGISGVIQ